MGPKCLHIVRAKRAGRVIEQAHRLYSTFCLQRQLHSGPGRYHVRDTCDVAARVYRVFNAQIVMGVIYSHKHYLGIAPLTGLCSSLSCRGRNSYHNILFVLGKFLTDFLQLRRVSPGVLVVNLQPIVPIAPLLQAVHKGSSCLIVGGIVHILSQPHLVRPAQLRLRRMGNV